MHVVGSLGDDFTLITLMSGLVEQLCASMPSYTGELHFIDRVVGLE